MTTRIDTIPKAFIWRRLQSLMGLWLVLFLIEHLITNSQAALLLGENGREFVKLVNLLHNLPYLSVIETVFVGIPIIIHTVWGIKYALTSKFNSEGREGTKPVLKYSRNRAFTWQRITSWILLVLLTVHVIKFRFVEYPGYVNLGTTYPTYFAKLNMDAGLYTVAARMGVRLMDKREQNQLTFEKDQTNKVLENEANKIDRKNTNLNKHDQTILENIQKGKDRNRYISMATKYHLKEGQVLALCPTFGTASLLTVRDTFKSPFWVAIYTVFVLSACFHAFNGMWTAIISWGWVIKRSAQTGMRRFAYGLMFIITFLGLAAIWGTYFLNLKH